MTITTQEALLISEALTREAFRHEKEMAKQGADVRHHEERMYKLEALADTICGAVSAKKKAERVIRIAK